MNESKEWYEISEKKEAFLKALNERFSFTKEGEMIPKHENSYEPIILSEYYESNELLEKKNESA